MLNRFVINVFIIHKELTKIKGEVDNNNKNFRRHVYGDILAGKIIEVRSKNSISTKFLRNEINLLQPIRNLEA